MTISPKKATDKPSIEEFVQGRHLGEGNFSRIVEATHKATGEKFALKIIEKQRIQRLRIRHQNIFNEINMEKDVLNRLRHQNIIRLYQTFQDDKNLYFLLELLTGGELLSHLLHEGRQLGLDEDLARFYLADIVNAVEYMHMNQVLHRDLKPENMVVCEELCGHLKIIDFGTAKNLDISKLNGPNFVGTPEYMPPETIANEESTYASDMWAFGCIVYQLLTGETPFGGGSAYLTFLRVQDGSYYMPDYLSDESRDLIIKLLQKNPHARLGGSKASAMKAVKAHPFFKGIDFACHNLLPQPSTHFRGTELFPLAKFVADLKKNRDALEITKYNFDALQDQINGLSTQDRNVLMHIFRRKSVLHLPGIYPRFFKSISRGRCLYARNHNYIGLTHELQNHWTENFFFMQLSGPKLGQASAQAEVDNRGGSSWLVESEAFLGAIKILNSQRPAFVVICGNFVNATPSQKFYGAQVAAFQEMLNHLSPQIHLVFAAAANEYYNRNELKIYQEYFGDAHFSFWFGGIKCIVANTAIFGLGEDFPEEEAAHAGMSETLLKSLFDLLLRTDWMKRELANGKLCARGTVVIGGQSLYLETRDCVNDASDSKSSEQLLAKYWSMVKDGHVCLMISGSSSINNVTSVMIKTSEDEADEYKCDIVLCKAPWGGASNVIHCSEVTREEVRTTAFDVAHPSTSDTSKLSLPSFELEVEDDVVAADIVSLT
ncbi:uncharacterized protein CCR75_008065 [Bremia lactucae]|uniref:Protein kinase domain-containing protein n=1 Tax=Bremia lactucae TaxID=4779 RepID=A0A976FEF2_BRELC|nr:hypothetical protein CCR75_008065 [Bremia lactucae]